MNYLKFGDFRDPSAMTVKHFSYILHIDAFTDLPRRALVFLVVDAILHYLQMETDEGEAKSSTFTSQPGSYFFIIVPFV